MYGLPKMQKISIGDRSVVGSKKCSTKPLSGTIYNTFEKIFFIVQRFHKKASFNHVVKKSGFCTNRSQLSQS